MPEAGDPILLVCIFQDSNMSHLPPHSSILRLLSGLTLGCSLSSVTHALDLEGHTGYMMVPSARTLPANTIAAAWNHHDNEGVYGDPYNLFGAIAPLPWTEVVCRYAFPDLSVNGKVGIPLHETELWGLYAGYGAQDVWGGAHLFHAQYGVATARFGLLEGSVGWGNGVPLDVYGSCTTGRCRLGTTGARLEGWFHGIALRMPLPKSWPAQLDLLEDYNGNTQRLGSRLTLRHESWGLQALVASRTDSLGFDPEVQVTASYQLSALASPPPPQLWELTPVVLQFGPALRTFVGTEFGNLDAQVALNSELYVNLSEHFLAGTRVRTRLWNSDNLDEGGPFHSQIQEPRVWWESGALGFVLDQTESVRMIAQGGWIDGDNLGSSAQIQSPEWRGFRAEFIGGAWYSPGWETSRASVIPGVLWNSPTKTWFGQVDAGRYWNQDLSSRLRVGRRWGGLSASLGLFRSLEADESLAEGRILWSFSGSGLAVSDWGEIRSSPEWSQGLRTKVGQPGRTYNTLSISPAIEPQTLWRLGRQ